MPVMWFVKDGPRPHTAPGDGIKLSFAELRGAFGKHRPQFLSKEPPQFNVETPSQYPRRVVIEVREEEGSDNQFPQSGFYIISDLSPEEAHELLSNYRGKR